MLTNYLDDVNHDISEILTLYENQHQIIEWGKISYALYGDYFEIANYNLNSLKNNLLLIENHCYRDSLTLLRASFEKHLYYQLMTRGKYYFLLFKKDTNRSMAQTITRLNSDIEAHRNSTGNDKIQNARVSPLNNKFAEVIYEGPYVSGKRAKGNLVPHYLSVFKQFDPYEAHLSTVGYFDYMPNIPKYTSVKLRRSKEQKYIYRYYLTFQAMQHALKINKLSSMRKSRLISAHYNFLSQFVHPTENSIDIAKTRNQHNAYIGNVDLLNEDSKTLQLLCLIYVGFISAGIIETLVKVLDDAPKKYIKNSNTAELKSKISHFYDKYNYFWFINNAPSDYDKFHYAVSRIGRNTFTIPFREIPNYRVPIQYNIFGRLRDLQSGMSNGTVGAYSPPFINE